MARCYPKFLLGAPEFGLERCFRCCCEYAVSIGQREGSGVEARIQKEVRLTWDFVMIDFDCDDWTVYFLRVSIGSSDAVILSKVLGDGEGGLTLYLSFSLESQYSYD